MAKRFVKISLATKFRLLFGVAVLGIISAALVVPWLFMELLVEQGIERRASEWLRPRFEEFLREHPRDRQAPSRVAALYTRGGESEGRQGPTVVALEGKGKAEHLDRTTQKAIKLFTRDTKHDLAVLEADDSRGKPIYRCFYAMRIADTCVNCHNSSAPVSAQFAPRQLVGVIDMTMPGTTWGDPLVWWTRAAFVVGGVLAVLLAVILLVLITQRLVLRPVRHLQQLADKVTEGDLGVRSAVRSGDELQRLGESFNEMLAAITDQHEKLRAANRALDLKLVELSEVNVALFQANKIKNEFLTNVSHELRTPLNSILGFADLVAQAGDERIARYGQNIESAAKSLLNMINDLLDLAKIEAGKAEVRLDKVSVLDTCQTLAALMKPLADKKNQDLKVEIAGDLPVVVTDGGKLQQILYNLLSNAIKFTPPGGQVMLSAGRSTAAAGGTGEELFIAVADNGPGIAEADQQLVFEKFYQADRTLTKESSGTGLGLAIARELTNLLGARLTLKSSPGQGAVFTLFLPIHPNGQ